MAEIVIPFKPRDLQLELYNSPYRFNVNVCHRRFGKTVYEINKLIRKAIECDLENPRFAYVAPFYRQAKTVAWDYLKHFTRPIEGAKWNEAELRADLPNGARISLYGGDPDALRGLYLDGVVLDEYAQMPPKMWSEVIRPALADRKGWADFIGTPMGHNLFYELYERARDDDSWGCYLFKASETGIIDPEELQAAKNEMSEDEYLQEFECSWESAIKGSYYGKLINDNQVTNVPYDTSTTVDTWWDLGMSDSTVIWFVQYAGQEIHLIDHYEMSGEGLPHYAKVLQDKGYLYGTHIAPHDIAVRELGTGKSRKEQAENLGIKFEVAPKLPVQHGIDAARAIIPRCWFDREKCFQGVEALKMYRTEYNEKKQVYNSSPLHDWTSHSADAFRYGAVTGRKQQQNWQEIEYPNIGVV